LSIDDITLAVFVDVAPFVHQTALHVCEILLI
jgi:hypothetical protein